MGLKKQRKTVANKKRAQRSEEPEEIEFEPGTFMSPEAEHLYEVSARQGAWDKSSSYLGGNWSKTRGSHYISALGNLLCRTESDG